MAKKPLLQNAITAVVPLSISLVCAAFLFLLPSTRAQTPARATHAHKHEYHREIDQMEEAWRKAMLQGNAVGLEALLADDYIAITAKGAIETKEQALANLRSGAVHLTAIKFSDRKIRVYGSTAVVTSVAEISGIRDKEDISGRFRYSRVYIHNQTGQWKIVSFEVNRIQEANDHK